MAKRRLTEKSQPKVRPINIGLKERRGIQVNLLEDMMTLQISNPMRHGTSIQKESTAADAQHSERERTVRLS